MQPTMRSPEPNISSTVSLKNTPTMPTGIIEMRILRKYFVSSFILNLNTPFTIQSISFHSITRVLSTVATCTITVNARLSSPFTPKSVALIARWPLLLTGRYSVSPCTRPRINASNQFISIPYVMP